MVVVFLDMPDQPTQKRRALSKEHVKMIHAPTRHASIVREKLSAQKCSGCPFGEASSVKCKHRKISFCIGCGTEHILKHATHKLKRDTQHGKRAGLREVDQNRICSSSIRTKNAASNQGESKKFDRAGVRILYYDPPTLRS